MGRFPCSLLHANPSFVFFHSAKYNDSLLFFILSALCKVRDASALITDGNKSLHSEARNLHAILFKNRFLIVEKSPCLYVFLSGGATSIVLFPPTPTLLCKPGLLTIVLQREDCRAALLASLEDVVVAEPNPVWLFSQTVIRTKWLGAGMSNLLALERKD